LKYRLLSAKPSRDAQEDSRRRGPQPHLPPGGRPGKRIGLEMGDQDIFVNVAGGLRVDEPAADLGIVCAMISSFLTDL